MSCCDCSLELLGVKSLDLYGCCDCSLELLGVKSLDLYELL